MRAKPFRLWPFGFLAFCLVISTHFLGTEARPVEPGLRVHEWGTFTSIAGNDGRAAEWLPLGQSNDLPGFVEHFRGAAFKGGLRGTVRMETPVLYFYAPREVTLSVKVAFSRGVITEWYPRASRVEPTAALRDASLYQNHAEGSIAWDRVTLAPGLAADFPREQRDAHYYAARETSATPLRVKASAGEQQEKFLFYRGVAVFPAPLSAKLTADGKLRIENRTQEAIPNVILLERRGEKLGYRIGGAVEKDVILDPPDLTATIGSLARDLEATLVDQGLYAEARAMVETWRHSWSEEGSRLLYIVPARFVDLVLPLAIHPAPAQTVRVFVGRLEIVTPATEKAVERAFASHDDVMLEKYGRFLEPILKTMAERESNPARTRQLQEYLNSFYKSQIAWQIAQTQRGN